MGFCCQVGTYLGRGQSTSTHGAFGQHEATLGGAALTVRGGVGHGPVAIGEEVTDGRVHCRGKPVRGSCRLTWKISREKQVIVFKTS